MKRRTILPSTTASAIAFSILILSLSTQAQGDLSLSTADGLSLTLSPDGQVTSVTLGGEELVSEPAPALWVRDMSRAAEPDVPNLLSNPGFEEGETGWSPLAANRDVAIALTAEVAHEGDWALEFVGLADAQGFGGWESDPIPVTGGLRYRVSGWFRVREGFVTRPSGSPVLWQRRVYEGSIHPTGLYLQWLDAQKRDLGPPSLAALLHWNAQEWKRVTREVVAPPDAHYVKVAVAARLEGQTLWADDISLIQSPEVEAGVGGTVVAESEGRLTQTATLANGLVITATYTAHPDHIAISGTVRDTSGQPRALEVCFALPVDLDGWTWWDDVRTPRPIGEPIVYENVVSADFNAWLPMSLYPYAAVTAGGGLALALRMDQPRVAELAYDAATGRYLARFHLGIDPAASKLAGQASFAVELYRFDPEWGFRAAMEKYARLHPEWMDTPRDLYQCVGYNQGSFLGPWAAPQAKEDDEANIYSAQYTAAEINIDVRASSEPRPTYAEALAAVQALIADPDPAISSWGRAITESVSLDANGDWLIKTVGVHPWDPDHWEAIWAADFDPEIAGGMAQWTIEQRVDRAFAATEDIGAHLDGVQIDNFGSTPSIDCDPAHLALADIPLTYSANTYQPGLHNVSGVYEYLAHLRQHLDALWGSDRALSVNFWGLGTVNYLAPWIDAFGSEGSSHKEGSNFDFWTLDYRRAIAYHKPRIFANQQPDLTLDQVREYANRCLFYGMMPVVGPHAAGWPPEASQVLTDTHRVLFQFWATGWEPVTHAWTDREAVWVERFGGRGEGLFFTLHNTLTETVACTLTVDAEALGIEHPAALTVTELVSGEEVLFEVEEGRMLIPAEVEGLGTLVFRLSGLGYRIYLPLVMKE